MSLNIFHTLQGEKIYCFEEIIISVIKIKAAGFDLCGTMFNSINIHNLNKMYFLCGATINLVIQT